MIIDDARRIYLGDTEVYKAYLGSSVVWVKPTPIIKSSGLTSNNGFTVGDINMKDMRLSAGTYRTEADYLPGNSALESIRTFWVDWGDDIFDGWGFFYIYDPSVGNYLSFRLTDINRETGYIATENFSLNGRTFTVKHGYPVTGIYKFDISVDDLNPFIFGADGEMGSNGSTINENRTHTATIDGREVTVFYNNNYQSIPAVESFYSYWIPYVLEEGTTKTYNEFVYSSDNLAIYSKPVTQGITVYMAKQNDVRLWVSEDLSII